MKKLLFAALLVLGLSTQVNAFGFRGNGCCGRREVVAPSCPTKCGAPSCEVNRIEAEKPRCVKYVEVEEAPLCRIEEIKTYHCPVGTTEAEACA